MEYTVGQRVYREVSDRHGTITGRKKVFSSKTLWEVDFDGEFTFVPESQLKISNESKNPEQLFFSRVFDDFQSFRQYLTHVRIRGGLTNIVYSMKYGDVEFLPYQFKPVFKFISSNEGRLLIADEVGLGKTIESLYIWKELQARDEAQRLLIVAPAMLRSKWKKDMEQHFGMKAEIVDATQLLDCCREAAKDKRKGFVFITSLQGIRYRSVDDRYLDQGEKNNPKVRLNKFFEELADESEINKVFDLTILDEAQWVTNPVTANFQTARRINEVSKSLLLLSATPVSNKESDLFSLLRILSPEEYNNEYVFNDMLEQNRHVVKLAHCFYDAPKNMDARISEAKNCIKEIKNTRYFGKDSFYDNLLQNIQEILSSDELRRKTYDQISDRYFYSSVFSRSRKRDVMKTARRTAQTVYFNLSFEEISIYDSCTEDLKEMCEEQHGQVYLFAIMARQRELSSCIPAALRRWRRLALFFEDDNCLEEDDVLEDCISNKEVEVPETCLQLNEDEIDYLEEHDTKYNAFISALRTKIEEGKAEGRDEKIIVFSFFRNTLRYLSERLTADGIYSYTIMGGMKQEEKDETLMNFRTNSKVNVLLSSEVGAEGLDLQFSRLEFNYDLPWNPMKLEQRIGRIDRIGQESEKILIVNMLSQNTVEDRVLDKLYTKIQIFNESIGELDEILGNLTQSIEYGLLSSNLTPEQKEQEAQLAIDRFYVELLNRKKLEEDAGLSKAYSDSILKYVSTAERNSRFVRKEDLINYMYDFFTKDANGSHFSKSKGDVWTLELSQKDRSDFGRFLINNGLTCGNYTAPKILCTFPQGRRSSYSGAFNIDVSHPLTKWILNHTDMTLKKSRPSCCYTMTVPSCAFDNTTGIESGSYVFFVSHLECDGLKKRNELMYFVSRVGTNQVMDSDSSEFFVVQCLFKGASLIDLSHRLENQDSTMIDHSMDLCRSASDSKADGIVTDLKIDIDAVYQRMIVKTKVFYDNKIAEIEQKIEENTRNNQTRILPANRGKLAKLKSHYDEALLELESKRNPAIIFRELALGLVFVE